MAILGVVPNGADHTLNSGLRTCVNIGGGRGKHSNRKTFDDSEDSLTINTAITLHNSIDSRPKGMYLIRWTTSGAQSYRMPRIKHRLDRIVGLTANTVQAMQKNLAYVPTRSTPGKLAEISQDELLDRLANGESPSTIAASLSVSRPALFYKLRDHPEYKLCREIGMDGNLDFRLDNVMSATDLNSARMEEVKLRRLEWRAEREFPHRWGQKTQVAVALPPSIDAALVGLASELLAKLAQGQAIDTIETEDAEISTPEDESGQSVDNNDDHDQK